MVSDFNFDKCMDLLMLIPSERLQPSHFEMILAFFNAGKKGTRRFYDGRKPNFDDV
jgi:hypothetical protein